jgi:hypothetical protein
MKRTKFVLLVAAMFAVSTMLTSCWSQSDSPSSDVTDVETGVVLHSISVTSNVTANVKVGSTTINIPAGETRVFENLTGTDYTVTATAAATGDFLPSKIQTVDVSFTDEKAAAVVTFNFVDATSQSAETALIPATGVTLNTIEVQNDAAAGVPETNETIPATMTIPASTTLTDEDGNPLAGDQTFSIVAYELPIQQTDDVEKEQVTETIALECKPDGTQFSGDGATLKAFIGVEAAGAIVVINDKEYTVAEDGYVTFNVKHFSSHVVGVKTNATKTTETITLVNQSISFNAGENIFPYDRIFGWESDIKGFFIKWLEIQFGKTRFTETVNAKFTATDSGTGRINITQEVNHYTINSGLFTFKATVWGAVTVTVIPDSGHGASTHSGGSGN